MDATIQAPRVVDMAASVSSSLVYIALTDVERWMSGARSALPFSIVMAAGNFALHGLNKKAQL
jgi:hypothetical protein